jgi:hypothetical protein
MHMESLWACIAEQLLRSAGRRCVGHNPHCPGVKQAFMDSEGCIARPTWLARSKKDVGKAAISGSCGGTRHGHTHIHRVTRTHEHTPPVQRSFPLQQRAQGSGEGVVHVWSMHV